MTKKERLNGRIMMKKIIDLFGWSKFNSMFMWIMIVLLILPSIITIAKDDFGGSVANAERTLASICLGLGGGLLLYRIFVIAYNDIITDTLIFKGGDN